jgi:uncharacterized protein
MGHAYLDAAHHGKNSVWRYIISIGMIMVTGLIIGSLPLLVVVLVLMLDGNPATGMNRDTGMLIGVDPLLTFPLFMASFIAFFLGINLAVTQIHRRPLVTLITPGRPVDWSRVLQGALAWAALVAVIGLVEAALFPGRFEWTLDLVRFLPFAAMALFLIPLQTTAEELFFRGYVLQGTGLLTRNTLILAFVSGLIFMLPHFANPEVAVNFWAVMGFYFIFGAAMAIVTLRDNSLELAIGVHAGNNLFTALLVNFEGSALQTPAAFTATGFDPWFNLIAGTLALIVFYALFFGRRRKVTEEARPARQAGG